MVTCHLIGRLGNQAFQIAACIAHARKNNTEYLIPKQTIAPHLWPAYFSHFPEYTQDKKVEFEYSDESFYEYRPIPYKPNMRLHGFYQSYKYFDDYRNEIIKAFNLPTGELFNIAAIHCRRGDYLERSREFPPLEKNYYYKSIKHLYELGCTHFFVFGDDPDYNKTFFTKSNFNLVRSSVDGSVSIEFIFPKYKNIPFSKPSGNDVIDDLILMSQCQYLIIANSSLSWWAAYLNQNPNKIIISPKEENWFGRDNIYYGKTKDLIPPEWLQI